MKTLYAFAFLAASFQLSFAQDKKTGAATPELAIEQVFDALSDGSIEKMEHVVTPDVKILEHGVVWTMDTIRNYLAKKRPADFKRVNTFDFFQTEVTEKMAFV